MNNIQNLSKKWIIKSVKGNWSLIKKSVVSYIIIIYKQSIK